MTKAFSIFLSMIFVQVAFADAKHDTLQETLEKLVKLGDAQTSNGNGASLNTYDTTKFSFGKAISEYQSYNNDKEGDSCRFNINVGRKANIKLLRDQSITEDHQIANLLEELHSQGNLKTIISATWDGDSGDSEYCSIYNFTVYTNEGHKLQLDFNHTD